MTYEGPSILYSIILQSYENVKKILKLKPRGEIIPPK